jgi:hypothetical protein
MLSIGAFRAAPAVAGAPSIVRPRAEATPASGKSKLRRFAAMTGVTPESVLANRKLISVATRCSRKT